MLLGMFDESRSVSGLGHVDSIVQEVDFFQQQYVLTVSRGCSLLPLLKSKTISLFI